MTVLGRSARNPDRSHRAEGGFLGGVDALAFGALVLITGTLLVVNAWSVVDTRMAVSAAAREAVRTVTDATVAELNDPGRHADLEVRARERARTALGQHGKDVESSVPTIVFGALDTTPRCQWVEATVTFAAPVVGLPFVGVFGDGIAVTVTHRERIDPYREGLLGEATCA